MARETPHGHRNQDFGEAMQRLMSEPRYSGAPTENHDMDVRTARIQALQANIRRYSRLLAAQLTEDERAFIDTRFTEGRLALEGLCAAPAVPARLLAGAHDPQPLARDRDLLHGRSHGLELT
jgi:hypothetical protein